MAHNKRQSVPSNAIMVSHIAAQRVITCVIVFTFRLGIFLLKFGKKEDILDWEWGLISDNGDREKRP